MTRTRVRCQAEYASAPRAARPPPAHDERAPRSGSPPPRTARPPRRARRPARRCAHRDVERAAGPGRRRSDSGARDRSRSQRLHADLRARILAGSDARGHLRARCRRPRPRAERRRSPDAQTCGVAGAPDARRRSPPAPPSAAGRRGAVRALEARLEARAQTVVAKAEEAHRARCPGRMPPRG